MLETARTALAEPDSAAAASDEAHFAQWRARELSRVERAGLAYLDYTGAALYPESLVRADALRLAGALLGNPHSEHAPSRAASADVDAARMAILSFLRADPAEYAVVLTSNATAACRLVAESFPFREASRLVLTADNHNSVNGIREYARARGAEVMTIPLDGELRLLEPLRSLDPGPRGPSLLALPAQSNFSGVRHPLDLVSAARARGYRVLLDAASYVPTAELRLDAISPDFVALSVYKIAGYPSGIGALVARHEALADLRRPSFAGGTVRWVSVQRNRHRLSRWRGGVRGWHRSLPCRRRGRPGTGPGRGGRTGAAGTPPRVPDGGLPVGARAAPPQQRRPGRRHPRPPLHQRARGHDRAERA